MTTSPLVLTVSFLTGTLITFTASFKRPPTQLEIDDGTASDADDWQPVDPDTVTARVGMVVDGTMDPLTISEHAYLNSPGDIVRDDVGEYHVDVTAGAANVGARETNYWKYKWESFGNGQAVNEGAFRVLPSEFP